MASKPAKPAKPVKKQPQKDGLADWAKTAGKGMISARLYWEAIKDAIDWQADPLATYSAIGEGTPLAALIAPADLTFCEWGPEPSGTWHPWARIE